MALRRVAWLLAGASLLLSCSEDTVSQVVLIVDSNLEVPTELDQIRFDVVGPEGMSRAAIKDLLAPGAELPALLTLVHRGGPLGPFEARVTGRLQSAPIVERSVRFSFVSRETLFLRADLFSSCVGSPCPSNQTCGLEGCREIDATEGELMPWTGMVPPFEVPTGCASDVDCVDSLDCTVDMCGAGSCIHEANDTLCAVGEQCDPSLGCLLDTGCSGDMDCDDGLFCNGAERCLDGTCQSADAPDCADEVPCTVDSCDEDADACVNMPDSTQCDDLVGCTQDACDAVVGCTHSPDNAQCTAGDLCDVVMGCTGRPCTMNEECDDGMACNGTEFCDVDVCRTMPAPDCNDGIPCTVDSCDDLSGCVNTPMDAACDDGVDCTVDVCDAVTGCSSTADDSLCDDGVDCTIDSCDGAACVLQPDTQACTLGELCDVATGCGLAATFTQIYTTVVQDSCSPCHTNGPNFSGELDLSTQMAAYTNLVDVPAICGTGNTRVIPYDSRTSLLWRKVAGVDLCGRRMPFGGTPLAVDQIAMIRDWIDAGAANN